MRHLLVPVLSVLMVATPALGQDRIFPGFEKVHGDLKKKEGEAIKDMVRADSEADAAEAQLLAGERQIADSDAAIEAQRAEYRAIKDRTGFAATSREAKAEAAEFENVAKAWERAEGERAKGEKMMGDAQADAEKAVRRRLKAETKLAEVKGALSRTIDTAAAPVIQDSPSPADFGAVEASPTDQLAPVAISEETLPEPVDTVELPAAPTTIDDELLGGDGSAAPLKSD